MATEYDDDFDEDEEDGPKGLRKRLRELEKLTKSQTEELTKYQRNEAFSKAGLNDLSEDQKADLAKLVDTADPDAYRRKAETLGLIQPKPDVDPAVQEAHQRVAEAASGAVTQAQTSIEDEYASAKTPEEVIRIAQKHGSPTTWDAFAPQ